ncbi:MAG: hypothetical protein ACYTFT_15365, partial [Planctomycetota bacterium]
MTETSAADAETEEEKVPKGCLIALLLLVVGIAGLNRSCFMPAKNDMNTVVTPGKPWKLGVTTNISTVNGLGRVTENRATLQLDGTDEVIPLEITGTPRDTWGSSTQVDIVTIKGVPVASGKKDIDLHFEVTVPDRPEWLGKVGDLRVQSVVVYPTFDFGEAVVGAHTGALTITQKTYDYDATFRAKIATSNPEASAARKREKNIDAVFTLLALLAVVIAVVATYRGVKADEAA